MRRSGPSHAHHAKGKVTTSGLVGFEDNLTNWVIEKRTTEDEPMLAPLDAILKLREILNLARPKEDNALNETNDSILSNKHPIDGSGTEQKKIVRKRGGR